MAARSTNITSAAEDRSLETRRAASREQRGRCLPDGPAGAQGAGTEPRQLVQRRTQVERWLGELSPIEELRLVQRRLDIDAGLARLDQADRLPELEEPFVKSSSRGQAQRDHHCGTTRGRRAGRVPAKAGL